MSNHAKKPVIAFKFMEGQYAVPSLEKARVKVTRVRDLNDPFEFRHRTKPHELPDMLRLLNDPKNRDRWRAVLRDSGRSVPGHISDGMKLRAARAMLNESDSHLEWLAAKLDEARVLSLARTAFPLLLWAHYAESHKGVALGFDLSGTSAGNVEYTNTMPDIGAWEDSSKILQLMLTKSRDWQYEQECRILLEQSELVEEGGVEFVEFGPRPLRQVIAGARSSAQLKSELRRVLSEERYQHVVYLEASCSSIEYKIEFNEVERNDDGVLVGA
ncbi:MAG: DUF2971 domain-containing protein [Planctomycetota bacterium]